MPTYNITEAKTHLGELIAKAQAGEIVVITRRGIPVARLSAPEPTPHPIDWRRIDALREQLPESPESSAELLRRMREEARY